MRPKTTVILATAALLCGCLPIPHHEPDIPALSGQVWFQSNPVPGAEIYVSRGLDHPTETKIADTDAHGEFHYPGNTRLVLFAIVLGDPGYFFKLCIVVGGKSYDGFSERGLGYAPEAMSLNCNLASKGKQACR